MDLSSIIDEVRTKSDDNRANPLTSDEVITRYANEAVDEVCLRTRCIKDSSSSKCSITLVAGTATYALDPAIFAVCRARIDGVRDPLTRTTTKDLDGMYPGWDDSTLTGNGTPEFMVFDVQQQTVTLYPTPSEAGTLRLQVWRRPFEAERLDVDDDSGEPAIPEHHHRELKHYILYEIYSNKDGEVYDPQRAQGHLDTFTQRVGRRPSLVEIQLWSTSPRRTSRPCYY